MKLGGPKDSGCLPFSTQIALVDHHLTGTQDHPQEGALSSSPAPPVVAAPAPWQLGGTVAAMRDPAAPCVAGTAPALGRCSQWLHARVWRLGTRRLPQALAPVLQLQLAAASARPPASSCVCRPSHCTEGRRGAGWTDREQRRRGHGTGGRRQQWCCGPPASWATHICRHTSTNQCRVAGWAAQHDGERPPCTLHRGPIALEAIVI